MRIQILSDIHNEFSVLPVPRTDADVVILAGDIDLEDRAIAWAGQFDKPVIYLTGNHEYYKGHYQTVNQRIKEAVTDTDVHFLNDEVAVIQGVRFIGTTLWTDFDLFGDSNIAKLHAQDAMNDYRLIRYGPDYRRLRPSDTHMLFDNARAFLRDRLDEPFEGKTVIVTHHAPSIQSVQPIYKQDRLTPSFASDLEYLMGEPVSLWVHGHVHNSNDYCINGTRVVSNPRGYQRNGPCENPEFNPELVVEV
jgi:predicted phosphodiesterase